MKDSAINGPSPSSPAKLSFTIVMSQSNNLEYTNLAILSRTLADWAALSEVNIRSERALIWRLIIQRRRSSAAIPRRLEAILSAGSEESTSAFPRNSRTLMLPRCSIPARRRNIDLWVPRSTFTVVSAACVARKYSASGISEGANLPECDWR